MLERRASTTAKLQALREAVRKFVDQQVEPLLGASEQAGAMSSELLDLIKSHGYNGLRISAEWGGQGLSFAAGLDTKEALPVGFPELLLDGLGDREALFRLRKPTIAAVTGAAFGAGLELALMCDLILCDETARFSLPEVTCNGMPGAGGTQRLARLIGRMRATELCLTGRAVLPGEAARLGLVLEIVAEGRVLEAAQRLAKQIAAAPTTNTMLIKQSCRSTDEIGLSAGLVLERTSSYACIANRQASQRE